MNRLRNWSNLSHNSLPLKRLKSIYLYLVATGSLWAFLWRIVGIVGRVECQRSFTSSQLTKAISPRRAKQILEFLYRQVAGWSQVLASSYFIATTMGSEDNQETSAWLNKAIVLSRNQWSPVGLHLKVYEMIRVWGEKWKGLSAILMLIPILQVTELCWDYIGYLHRAINEDIRRKMQFFMVQGWSRLLLVRQLQSMLPVLWWWRIHRI